MQNTGASFRKYHFTNFCVAVLIPTENICFSCCKRWSKTSEMQEDNYSDKFCLACISNNIAFRASYKLSKLEGKSEIEHSLISV